MNYKTLLIFLLITLSINNVTNAQENADSKGDYFRNVKFGSTRDEIKEIEKNNKMILDTQDELIFNEQSDIFGNSQNIYNFDENGKMDLAILSIVNDHKDLANYIDEYNKINEFFIKTYGNPSESVFSPEDKDLLSNPAKLAEAIKAGEVVATTIWNKENITISHILADALDSDDMGEEAMKVTIINPISHIVSAELNFTEDELEDEGISDSDNEDDDELGSVPEDEAETAEDDNDNDENESEDEDEDAENNDEK